MPFLHDLFASVQEDAWRQIAAEVGGRFDEGNLFGGRRVQAAVGDWIVTLDTVNINKDPHTRMRAPFLNRDGLRFTLYRSGLFTDLGKLLGMQDVDVAHPGFDRAFVVQSPNPARVRALLQNQRLREALQQLPSVFLTIRDDDGFLGPGYPQGVDQVFCHHPGNITDLGHLRALFNVFAETLNTLCHLDSAYKDDMLLHIETLAGPGGLIREGGVVLWDGDVARQRAAQALGHLRDARALDALLVALTDPNPALVASAAWALGNLGQPLACPSLITLLGDFRPGADRPVSHTAGEALAHLGRAADAQHFNEALAGQTAGLTAIPPCDRSAFIAAFCLALQVEHPVVVHRAAEALGCLGAVEAAPAIRAALRDRRNATVREALDTVLEGLTEHSRLPRPAQAPAPTPQALPIPAAPATTDGSRLPRPSAG